MSWLLTYLWWTLIVIFLIYAFQWLLSFVPWFFWFVFKIVFYPIEIINQVVYPVWSLPYLIIIWFISFIVFKLIIDFFNHKS